MTLSKDTLTGLIAFDSNIRKGYTFDVVELQPSGIVQVGTWDEVNNFTSQRVAKTNTIYENVSLANKTFKILLSIPVSNNKKIQYLIGKFRNIYIFRINPMPV